MTVRNLRNLATVVTAALAFTMTLSAQTSAVSGSVNELGGRPVQDAMIKIVRTDIKQEFQVKTNKEGHYTFTGLPLGTYDLSCFVHGKEIDKVENIRTRTLDPLVVDFDMLTTATESINPSPWKPASSALFKLFLHDTPMLGAKAAPITIVEFTDYQCPFCQRFQRRVFGDLKKNYIDTGLVRYYSRDLPLDSIHPSASRAAEGARCAGEQGQFWAIREIFAAHPHNLAIENLLADARQLNIDVPEFRSCVQAQKYKNGVQADVLEAIRIGVEATPSFIIGLSTPDGVEGELMVGAQNYPTFDVKLRTLENAARGVADLNQRATLAAEERTKQGEAASEQAAIREAATARDREAAAAKREVDFGDGVLAAVHAAEEPDPFASIRQEFDLSGSDSRQWKTSLQLPDAERCALLKTAAPTPTATSAWTFGCLFRASGDGYERMVKSVQSILNLPYLPDEKAVNINQVFFADASKPASRLFVAKINAATVGVSVVAVRVAGVAPNAVSPDAFANVPTMPPTEPIPAGVAKVPSGQVQPAATAAECETYQNGVRERASREEEVRRLAARGRSQSFSGGEAGAHQVNSSERLGSVGVSYSRSALFQRQFRPKPHRQACQ